MYFAIGVSDLIGRLLLYVLIAIFVVPIAFGLFVYFYYNYNYGSVYYEWRYKITVEVDTPSGAVSGSAVHQVQVEVSRNKPGAVIGQGYKLYLDGEAVVVDLPNGKRIFALLRQNDGFGGRLGYVIPRLVIPEKVERHERLRMVVSESKEFGKEFVVPESRYPLLVTFEEVNLLSTMKWIKPDTLQETFGPGYAINKIFFEFTDEEVGSGMPDGLLESILQQIKNRPSRPKDKDGNRIAYFERPIFERVKQSFFRSEELEK